MIVFRGRAHCIAYPERCGNAGCDRAMTRAKEFEALRWWSGGASRCGSAPTPEPPVGWMDFLPGCAESLPPVEFRLRGNDGEGGDGAIGKMVVASGDEAGEAAAAAAGIGE